MKKVFVAIGIISVLSLGACGGKTAEKDDGPFKPSLDPNTACDIKIVGSYDNFEALEAEFDRFNEYYPNVELSYTKIDDYNKSIATVLNGKDAPNIFFSFSWMIGNSKYDIGSYVSGLRRSYSHFIILHVVICIYLRSEQVCH